VEAMYEYMCGGWKSTLDAVFNVPNALFLSPSLALFFLLLLILGFFFFFF
jgi:ABC-type proline/glycine betaine transport system permease subunit